MRSEASQSAEAVDVPDLVRAGVVGDPVAHSLSPVMHRAACRVLGVPLRYDAHHAPAGALVTLLHGLAEDPRWRGLSVTMPHKADAARLADACSDRVALLNAANTLVVGHPEAPEHGRFGPGLWAHNTDVDGIVHALNGGLGASKQRCGSAGGPAGLEGATVGVIGNGGTAAAAVLASSLLGAAAVSIYARSARRAATVLELAGRCGLAAEHRPLEAVAAEAPDLGAVVSTLPPHAADGLARSVTAAMCAVPPVLLDVAYDPWPSALAQAWADRGGRVVSGRAMLVGQGIEQVRLFTRLELGPSGSETTADRWRAAALAAMEHAVGEAP